MKKDTFDLRAYLVENKMTTNSRGDVRRHFGMLNEMRMPAGDLEECGDTDMPAGDLLEAETSSFEDEALKQAHPKLFDLYSDLPIDTVEDLKNYLRELEPMWDEVVQDYESRNDFEGLYHEICSTFDSAYEPESYYGEEGAAEMRSHASLVKPFEEEALKRAFPKLKKLYGGREMTANSPEELKDYLEQIDEPAYWNMIRDHARFKDYEGVYRELCSFFDYEEDPDYYRKGGAESLNEARYYESFEDEALRQAFPKLKELYGSEMPASVEELKKYLRQIDKRAYRDMIRDYAKTKDYRGVYRELCSVFDSVGYEDEENLYSKGGSGNLNEAGYLGDDDEWTDPDEIGDEGGASLMRALGLNDPRAQKAAQRDMGGDLDLNPNEDEPVDDVDPDLGDEDEEDAGLEDAPAAPGSDLASKVQCNRELVTFEMDDEELSEYLSSFRRPEAAVNFLSRALKAAQKEVDEGVMKRLYLCLNKGYYSTTAIRPNEVVTPDYKSGLIATIRKDPKSEF